MENTKIIQMKYSEAVQGIKEEWFFDEEDVNWYNHIINLPMDKQATYLIVVLYRQVFNGGFNQYFSNGYGQFAKATIRALLTICAKEKARLLSEAYRLVNSENYPDEVFRNKLLKHDIKSLFNSDNLSDLLDKLDHEFYASDEKEDLEELLGAYLRKY